jgi:hypothetical protein
MITITASAPVDGSTAPVIYLACSDDWCTWSGRVGEWPSVAVALEVAREHIGSEHSPAPHPTCIETTNYRAGATGRTYACGPECPDVSRETSPFTGGAPAVGMPTDERALRDRQRSGCLLRSGQLCPCPAGAFAYDGCERVKVVG